MYGMLLHQRRAVWAGCSLDVICHDTAGHSRRLDENLIPYARCFFQVVTLHQKGFFEVQRHVRFLSQHSAAMMLSSLEPP